MHKEHLAVAHSSLLRNEVKIGRVLAVFPAQFHPVRRARREQHRYEMREGEYQRDHQHRDADRHLVLRVLCGEAQKSNRVMRHNRSESANF